MSPLLYIGQVYIFKCPTFIFVVFICRRGFKKSDKQAKTSPEALAYLRCESIYEIDQLPSTSGQSTVKPQPLAVETAAQATRRRIDAVKIELDQLCSKLPENPTQREEELTRLLFVLDDIDVHGDSKNRAQRRKVIAEVQAVLKEQQSLHTGSQIKTRAQVARERNPRNTQNILRPQRNIFLRNKKRHRATSNSSHGDLDSSSFKAYANCQVILEPMNKKVAQENKTQGETYGPPMYFNLSDSNTKSTIISEIPATLQSQVLQNSKREQNETSKSNCSDQFRSKSDSVIVQNFSQSKEYQTHLLNGNEQTGSSDFSTYTSDTSYFKQPASSITQTDMALDLVPSLELVIQDGNQSQIGLKANIGEEKNLVTDMEIVDEQPIGMDKSNTHKPSAGHYQMLPPVKATGEIEACPMVVPGILTETQAKDTQLLDISGTITEQEEGPLQLLSQDQQSGKFVLNQEVVSRVLAGVKHHKLVIVSIVGAFRRGKSFLLNFLLRYLKAGVSYLSTYWSVVV
jgi:hypothetical protein